MAHEVPGGDQGALTELWRRRWPDCDPVGHRLRGPYRDVWVRFHSLPGSKRYPEDEGEYGTVLARHNTVLGEMFAGMDIHVIRPEVDFRPDVPAHAPGTGHWRTLLVEDDPDPRFRTYYHLFTERRGWQRGCLDGLLRRVADEEVVEVLITDIEMRRIYHPYDGGADVFLSTPAERDRLRDRHADWLSGHPSGL